VAISCRIFWFSLRSSRQAKAAPGNLRAAVLNDANLVFWTCTVWQDEAAMRSFMMSGAHRKAMPHLLDWCDEASVAHWQQETAELPAWPEVYRRLQKEGRRSRVRHPTEAQQRFEIPAPRA
jgi:hypothetical protein